MALEKPGKLRKFFLSYFVVTLTYDLDRWSSVTIPHFTEFMTYELSTKTWICHFVLIKF